MLKPDGQLYIHDVILEQDNATEVVKAFINKQSVAGGDFLKRDAEGHFQQEHSTYDWILDGLLARTGFRIVSRNYSRGRDRKNTIVLEMRALYLNFSAISE